MTGVYSLVSKLTLKKTKNIDLQCMIPWNRNNWHLLWIKVPHNKCRQRRQQPSVIKHKLKVNYCHIHSESGFCCVLRAEGERRYRTNSTSTSGKILSNWRSTLKKELYNVRNTFREWALNMVHDDWPHTLKLWCNFLDYLVQRRRKRIKPPSFFSLGSSVSEMCP